MPQCDGRPAEYRWRLSVTRVHGHFSREDTTRSIIKKTSSLAIAEGPRDALSQLKFCQLLHNCTKNHVLVEGLPFHVV